MFRRGSSDASLSDQAYTKVELSDKSDCSIKSEDGPQWVKFWLAAQSS